MLLLPQNICKNCLKISLDITRKNSNRVIIRCKNNRLNHHVNQIYNKFEEVPLASKGWAHRKSKGDYFTVLPQVNLAYSELVSLSDTGVNSKLISALNGRGITSLTKFQSETIPKVTRNSNVLLAAETGCGKTITYLVPMIQALIDQKSTDLNTPKGLVVVPNRELAYQVGDVAQSLAEAVGLKVEVLVGGRTKKLMMNPEFNDIDVLVATPGALGKLATVGVYRLNQVLYTVFDEADTLIDDSFIERLSGIIRRTPQSKMILVSATRPKRLPDILKPIEMNMIECISPRIHKPFLHVTQKFLRLNLSSRPSQLLHLAKNNKHPMLIFTNRNETSNWLSLFLNENGVVCANINGDMNYNIRIEQWNRFINGEANILSATDVGSRGLDTIQVKHVLNYDFPLYAADYLHRIGRVGRIGSGENCKITNFVTGSREVALVQQIELAIRLNQPLSNVDGNITKIVQKKILQGIRQTA